MNSWTWMSSSPLLSIFRISPQEFLKFLMQTVLPSYPKIPRRPTLKISQNYLQNTDFLLPFPDSSFTTMPFFPCHWSLQPTQPKAVPPKKTKDQGSKDFCHLIKLQCAISRSVEFFEEVLDRLLGLCRRHGEFWCHGVQQKKDFLKGTEVVSPKETFATVLMVLIKLQVSKYQCPCCLLATKECVSQHLHFTSSNKESEIPWNSLLNSLNINKLTNQRQDVSYFVWTHIRKDLHCSCWYFIHCFFYTLLQTT